MATYSLDAPTASKPDTGSPVNITVTSTDAELTNELVQLVLDTLQTA